MISDEELEVVGTGGPVFGLGQDLSHDTEVQSSGFKLSNIRCSPGRE